MPNSTHDVAISAVSYDSRLVAELTERLARRVGPAISWYSAKDDVRPDPAADLAAAALVGESARVVVVLHQRLWGRDGGTAVEATALRERVRAKRHKSVRVVTLDAEPVPSWLRTAQHSSLAGVGLDALAEGIVAAVVSHGGTATPAPVASPAVVASRPAWGDGPPSFMAQPRAHTALKREFDLLITELTERVRFESDRLGDKQVELHCAPQRLVVQLGPVGLSMSWVAGRSGNLADGRLLVIEWDGAIAHGRAMGGGKTASPTREQTYRPEANGPDDWCWRPEGGEASSYSSKSLAGQCFTSANMGRSA